MFSGPQAASPPMKTPAREVMKVVLSTIGMSHLLKSIPMSRSIQGKAVSCPIARITSSHSITLLSWTSALSRPFSPGCQLTRSKTIPFTLPSSMMKRDGEWFSRISTCSSIASSSSQDDALK